MSWRIRISDSILLRSVDACIAESEQVIADEDSSRYSEQTKVLADACATAQAAAALKDAYRAAEEVSQTGITVLVVTHEHELVHRFHQRVVTLNHGRIVSDVPAAREEAVL